MKRASYKDALTMLLDNDQSWIHEADGSPSIEAALVRDLFGVTPEKLRIDLIRTERNRAALNKAEELDFVFAESEDPAAERNKIAHAWSLEQQLRWREEQLRPSNPTIGTPKGLGLL